MDPIPATDRVENAGPTVSSCVTFQIDHISEVADALNISASALIKGKATGSIASLVDPAKFYDGSVNFLVRVTVVTKHIIALAPTEFAPVPIDGAAPADFTRAHGDAYVAGFAEGGELNALVSVKPCGRAAEEDIRARLAAMFDFTGRSAPPDSGDHLGETTIAVSWIGGGGAACAQVDCWTLASLRAAALAFPERVVCRPERTSALLARYTDLKGFHGSTSKTGGPLAVRLLMCKDISFTLLDAYMDYKLILRYLVRAAQDVARGTSILEDRTNTAQLAEAAQQAKDHYKGHISMQTHVDDDDDDEVSSASPAGAKSGCKPAILPNDLVPYNADIFGLHKAVRDCQLEMIKIVQEIDILAVNPDIAADAMVKDLGIERAMKAAAEEAEQTMTAQNTAIEDLTHSLTPSDQPLISRPYNFVPAIGLNVLLRIKSEFSGKVFDFNIPAGDIFQQWDLSPNSDHQKFTIAQAGALGFHIVHVGSGRRVAASPPSKVAGSVPLIVDPAFASVFVFEDAGGGTVRIRLADQPRYSVVVDGHAGRRDNGARLVLQSDADQVSNRWYFEAF
ncbi:hypothetical protein PHLGIDRAFT_123551 [Phlebiopsis gigantea 11061_1 CR5-6]|uniref:Uncharacterized protein n=1 Tax=Phlebiopsis gigantea (strain 11061_1 CR5-6) TaxID=745531 RepID=A0A0C3N9P1_PHLG1|nr:hypothetical protein PHLGIDRAFT_123551 [Phlebiopsis gigantea 11061_1 CR5-6]